jgi:hypothetical protein
VKLILVACFLFASGTTHAADWLSLGKAEDGNSESFVDRSTIAVVVSVRSARFKYVLKHHIDMYKTRWIERSEAFSEYDCKRKTTHAIELIIYLEGGDTHSVPLPAEWQAVKAPWDQVALNYLCAWQGDQGAAD